MKKTWILLAALFLAISPADARTVRKVYEIDDFTGVNVTNAFSVTLERSNDFKVEIEISEEFLPFLLIRNRGGVLELNFTKLPFRLRQKVRNRVARAVISLPVLTGVTMSGASKLSSNDQFTNAMDKFVIDLRGASEIGNLNIKSPDVEIRLAGASKASLSLRTSDLDAELAGASRLELAGESGEFDIKAAGASRVDALEFEAENVEVKASGASTVDVRVTERLSVELSGASKCRYSGDSDYVKIKADQISGGSTLKQVKN